MKGPGVIKQRRARILQFLQEHTPFQQRPDFVALAPVAIRSGLYSVNTNIGDIECAMRRIWCHNTRQPLFD